MPYVQNRVHYKLRSLIDYCKEKGIEPIELSWEEQQPFILREDWESGFMPMMLKSECEICGKITGQKDRIYMKYFCSVECLKVMEQKSPSISM